MQTAIGTIWAKWNICDLFQTAFFIKRGIGKGAKFRMVT